MIILNNIFSQMNTMLIGKHTFCILKKNKISRVVIKVLLQLGLLKQIQLLPSNYLVRLNMFNSWGNYGLFFKLQNISTRSRNISITTYLLKGLLNVSNRNTYFIINSKHGLLLSSIAINLSLGGLLVARLLKV